MTRRYPIAIVSAFALLLLGTTPAPAWAQTGQNVLMIIADDIGVDMIGAYQPYEGSTDVPPTPTIDHLAAEGIQFLNTWSNPMCATTRATIQTGRYGYRTGVMWGGGTLPDEEFSIAEILSRDAALDYTTATFGKWGLGDYNDDGTHPVRTGYDFFEGTIRVINDYFDWEKHTAQFDAAAPTPPCDLNDPAWHNNPTCIAISTDSISNYATTETVDDTIDWINSRPPGQSWFAILSFAAPHRPCHAPPDTLHSFDLGAIDCADVDGEPICYRAMIEAMDSEIQRLLDNLPPSDTTIIFLGDNGSPNGMARDPFDPDRAKGYISEGGINVPLIIAGAGVSGTHRVSEALVNTTDLFMTVLELTGVDPSALPTNLPDTGDRYHGQAWEHDSFSLVPILSGSVGNIREYVYAERAGSKRRTIRNRAGYKLRAPLHYLYGSWEFYDLNTDAFEETNLVDGLVNPKSGKLLERGLLDAEAEAAYFDLSHKLDILDNPKLPAANLDSDADAVADGEDNCSALANQDQRDTNQDGYGNACDADYDNDGDVDDDDFAILEAAYGSRVGDPNYDPDIDCEGDGRIGISDFICFKRLEGLPPGPSGLACAGTIPCIADADGDGARNLDDNCKVIENSDQRDTNQDGYGNACDADYDNDGDVDDDDFAILEAAYGSRVGDPNYDPDIDCEGDGRIGISDFICFKAGAGPPPGPAPVGLSGLVCAGTVPCVSSE